MKGISLSEIAKHFNSDPFVWAKSTGSYVITDDGIAEFPFASLWISDESTICVAFDLNGPEELVEYVLINLDATGYKVLVSTKLDFYVL